MDGYNFGMTPAKTTNFRSPKVSGETLEAQLAREPGLKEAAYRIRYEAYSSYGYVEPRPNRLFSDRYDERRNCKTAVIFKHGLPSATIRIATFDPENIDPDFHQVQAMEIFGDEIRAILSNLKTKDSLAAGRCARAVEIGKLARLTEHSKDMEIIFALFRTIGYLVLHQDVDIVFNAVRAHHMPMYRRLGFHQLEPPRLYPGLTFQTGLMACFRTSYDNARDNLPFLRGISTTDDAYAGLIAGDRVPIFGTNHRNPTPHTVTPARLAG